MWEGYWDKLYIPAGGILSNRWASQKGLISPLTSLNVLLSTVRKGRVERLSTQYDRWIVGALALVGKPIKGTGVINDIEGEKCVVLGTDVKGLRLEIKQVPEWAMMRRTYAALRSDTGTSDALRLDREDYFVDCSGLLRCARNDIRGQGTALRCAQGCTAAGSIRQATFANRTLHSRLLRCARYQIRGEDIRFQRSSSLPEWIREN